jgi:CRP-like cAMP-binding protein
MKDLRLTSEQTRLLFQEFDQVLILEEGDYFLKENQICDKIGFIKQGMCRHFYLTEKNEFTRWVALPNNFLISISSFLTQRPSVEYIQALKKTEIIYITQKRWLEIQEEHEFIRQLWTKSIEDNYIGMEDRVFNLIAKTAEERYQWMLEKHPLFNQFVPDKYLASMLGVTPRHLSRIRALTK